jgi:hypothetical protein
MAWERHGDRTFFYRSVRRQGAVEKIYYGGGEAGQTAAAIHSLSQAECHAEQKIAQRERQILQDATSVLHRLNAWCDLIAAAALYAAGFHRARRHQWRSWRNGKAVLKKHR